jgi:hypothetical protein
MKAAEKHAAETSEGEMKADPLHLMMYETHWASFADKMITELSANYK